MAKPHLVLKCLKADNIMGQLLATVNFTHQKLPVSLPPDLKYLLRESKAWNRRMNRGKVTIDWRFTRKKARETFSYDRNSFTRSWN